MSTYVITEPCVGVKEGSCVDVCPAACIHTTPDAPQYYIDPDICIACEQCVIVCPVEAIFLDVEVPEKWHSYIDINADFFRKNKEAPQPVPVATAMHMILAVQKYAAENGIAVAAAVVDEGGSPIAFARMDSTNDQAVDLALKKAQTSASFHIPTHELAPNAQQPWFRSLLVFSAGRFVAMGGAIPIVDGPFVLGAIGVAGSTTPQQDIQCCRVGLAALEGTAH